MNATSPDGYMDTLNAMSLDELILEISSLSAARLAGLIASQCDPETVARCPLAASAIMNRLALLALKP